MDQKQRIIGTIEGKTADNYNITCNYNRNSDEILDTLKEYGINDGIISYDYIIDANESYKNFGLNHGVKIAFNIFKTQEGVTKVNIIEKIRTYERPILNEYLDTLMKRGFVNHMVPEILAESEQIPIDFGNKDEVLLDDVVSSLKDDEVFTDNANYRTEANNFTIYDNNGKVLFSIISDFMSGIKFVFPFENDEEREAFLDLCDKLQNIRAIKYPKV